MRSLSMRLIRSKKTRAVFKVILHTSELQKKHIGQEVWFNILNMTFVLLQATCFLYLADIAAHIWYNNYCVLSMTHEVLKIIKCHKESVPRGLLCKFKTIKPLSSFNTQETEYRNSVILNVLSRCKAKNDKCIKNIWTIPYAKTP